MNISHKVEMSEPAPKKQKVSPAEANKEQSSKNEDANRPMLLVLAGDKSGSGKSTISMGILAGLLDAGFKPSELAYIKPVTQCEDVQLVCQFCEWKRIDHRGVGPVRFYEGFTKEVIDGKDPVGDEGRYEQVRNSVAKIGTGKKIVLVDGVGYPAVGSCANISNAHIAKALNNSPVLLVGRPGLGDAIDSTNMHRAWFEKHGVQVLGACWNKIPIMSTYHPYEECKEYVVKYFKQNAPGFGCYGHIPSLESLAQENKPAVLESCMLRASKEQLAMKPEHKERCLALLATLKENLLTKQLLADLKKFHGHAD
eukprot:g47238.t1